ncbi:hypothetical protein AcV5_008901 [Taiwanofungus camphoratus]|nr:hypothetical protein AcV5_008901 [Antrodia cinnamomea]KAI0956503.1 hypothetical protein AcV7_006889 [Antrodia cinnamomea]
MSSIAAHLLEPQFSAYQSTKWAVLRFTELILSDSADKGVIAYSVHPGAIPTDMTSILPDSMQYIIIDTLEPASHTIVWLLRERREWLAGRYISSVWDMEELLAKKKGNCQRRQAENQDDCVRKDC